MKNILPVFFLFTLVLFTFCKSKQPATGSSQSTDRAVVGAVQSTEPAASTSQTSEPAVVYKTKADYSMNVPVTLNEAKTAIVAYPSPKDVFYKGRLAYPTKLDNGYYLDNRGIGVNAAFLKLSYEQYSKLSAAPSMVEMMNMLIDKDPFTEIYNLGARSQFTNEVADINKLIATDGLKKFKRIK